MLRFEMGVKIYKVLGQVISLLRLNEVVYRQKIMKKWFEIAQHISELFACSLVLTLIIVESKIK